MNLCAKGFHRCKSYYGRGKVIEEIVKENSLNRQFEQNQIDAICVTDIIYITCNDGRCHIGGFTHEKEIVIYLLQIWGVYNILCKFQNGIIKKIDLEE